MNPRRFVLQSEGIRERAAAAVAIAPMKWEVIVRPVKRKRSEAQNRYYHALKAHIAKDAGYTPDEMHQIIKAEYFGTRKIEVPGHPGRSVTVIKGSTTDLSVEEFTNFIDWFTAWATEHHEVDARTMRRAYGA